MGILLGYYSDLWNIYRTVMFLKDLHYLHILYFLVIIYYKKILNLTEQSMDMSILDRVVVKQAFY